MPDRRRAIPLIAAPVVLLAALLSGCASDPEPGASATDGAADSGVEVGTDTSVAPEISLPDGDPPQDLVVDVVVEGEGDPVEAGDLLVADYTGVLWDGGEQFDSSWDRGQPAAFPIGVGAVIDGWDTGLVGVPVGSRVVLVVPPEQGYGEAGSGETIPPDATLVFAVDVRDSFGAADAAFTAVDDLPGDIPEVSGEPGQAPTVTIGSAPEPSTSRSVLLGEGLGEPLDLGGEVVVHAVSVTWPDGETTYSTWDVAPEALPVAGLPGLAEALDGASAGARVLVLLTAEDSGSEPLALVLDVLGST